MPLAGAETLVDGVVLLRALTEEDDRWRREGVG